MAPWMRRRAPRTTSWCARRAQPTRSRPRTTWSGTTSLRARSGASRLLSGRRFSSCPTSPLLHRSRTSATSSRRRPLSSRSDPVSSSDPQQLYRVNVTWKADNGLSSYPGGTDYVYYTPTDHFVYIPNQYGEFPGGGSRPRELPSRSQCVHFLTNAAAAGLNTGAEESLDCFSGPTPTVNTAAEVGLHVRTRRPRDVQLPDDALSDRPGAGGQTRRIASDDGRRDSTSRRLRVWGRRSVTLMGSR